MLHWKIVCCGAAKLYKCDRLTIILRVLVVLGHRERVGDLENTVDIQTHQLASDCGRDRLAAVLDNLEDDLSISRRTKVGD